MKTILLATLLLTQGAIALQAQSAAQTRANNLKKKTPRVQTGTASYYSARFKGRLTASGERYDPAKMTAAHNRLPMGTMLRVTNLRNKKSVIVRVNDRLHFKNKRVVDLSRAAAAKLGYLNKGLAKVKVEVLPG